MADGELLFLVNTSIEAPSSGFVESQEKGVELWDCETGIIVPYPFVSEGGATKVSFQLPPCGSLLLFLSMKPLSASHATPPAVQAAGRPAPIRFTNIDSITLAKDMKRTAVRPSSPIEIRRVGPNVLNLDYMDVTAGGKTKRGLYFYRANQFAFAQNGMEQNPWDSAVQFKDELISKRFPPRKRF